MVRFPIYLSALSLGLLSQYTFATEDLENQSTDVSTEVEAVTTSPSAFFEKHPKLKKWRESQHQLKDKLWIDVNVNQPEAQNDPFQTVNRKIFNFNSYLDRTILRPLATNYTALPENARDSYQQFHNNLEEPWSAANQIIQGRPQRALKSLGRFALNTLTSLGFADVARHADLDREADSLETTLGYYNVPSGPYVMLPILGPNTFRSTFALAIDRQGSILKHALNDQGYTFYLAEKGLYGIDRRARLIDLEPTLLGGDEYAKMRDFYIQYTNFQIAEKRGLTSENLFIDDIPEDDVDSDDQLESIENF